MFTITKSVLFSILTVVATAQKTDNVFVNNPGRIVGGDTAEPGDYPYFVEMGGCGGTLFAPDMVLFAAHCENWKDKQLNIGAYKSGTIEEGSQVRFCEVWEQDPQYGEGSSDINYDFALCRLNKPVEIDSKVRLELNDDDSFPQEDKTLIAMGVGATTEGGQQSSILRDVELPTLTNDECRSYYGSSAITDIMLCAGFREGTKDSCQGDSGGPLVSRKVNNDGTITDTHVGVVSWGYGCARAYAPGVYARTSKRIDWIQDTACSMGSIADFCENNDDPAPAPGPCNGEELTVNVNTDKYGVETIWALYDSSNGEEVMKRSYLINWYENEHTICLKKNSCYEYIIGDTYGDGMCVQGNCGSYSLALNGEEILSEIGDFEFRRDFRFCTGDGTGNSPSDSLSSSDSSSDEDQNFEEDDFCSDFLEFEFNFDPKKTCGDWVAKGKKRRIKKKCKKEWLDMPVYFWCPGTCGEVGLSPEFCTQ